EKARSDAPGPATGAFAPTTNGHLARPSPGQPLDPPRLPAAAIQSVACCSMREGIVLYDRDGEAIWACANVDARASRAVAELKEIHDYRFESEVYEVSGQTMALSAMPRLLWLAHHRPAPSRTPPPLTTVRDWPAPKPRRRLAVAPDNGRPPG
ncbi:hypothetical protein BUE65_21905, partial [Klebsiella variicola]